MKRYARIIGRTCFSFSMRCWGTSFRDGLLRGERGVNKLSWRTLWVTIVSPLKASGLFVFAPFLRNPRPSRPAESFLRRLGSKRHNQFLINFLLKRVRQNSQKRSLRRWRNDSIFSSSEPATESELNWINTIRRSIHLTASFVKKFCSWPDLSWTCSLRGIFLWPHTRGISAETAVREEKKVETKFSRFGVRFLWRKKFLNFSVKRFESSCAGLSLELLVQTDRVQLIRKLCLVFMITKMSCAHSSHWSHRQAKPSRVEMT